jgi:hypothetical protein
LREEKWLFGGVQLSWLILSRNNPSTTGEHALRAGAIPFTCSPVISSGEIIEICMPTTNWSLR